MHTVAHVLAALGLQAQAELNWVAVKELNFKVS